MKSIASLVRKETFAALDGLRPFDPERFDVDTALQTLVYVGDVLRLGSRLPRDLVQWLSMQTPEHLGAVAAALTEDVEQNAGPGSESDEDVLAWAVRCLDRAESGRTALLRAAISQGLAVIDLPGFTALCDRLDRARAEIAQAADRGRIECALGDRRVLLGDRSWVDDLPEDSAESVPLPGNTDEEPALSPEMPPDAVLTAYTTRGVHRAWVEGAAGHDPDFAEELDGVIEALQESGHACSLVSLAWRRRTRRHTREPLAIHLEAPRLAAATAETGVEASSVNLGRLDPVAAEAVLGAGPDQLELHVFAEPGQVRRVVFGGSATDEPDEHGDWVVRIALTTEPVRIVVEGLDDQRFEDLLEIRLQDDE